MRCFALLCCAAVLVGCAKTEDKGVKDTSTAPPAAPTTSASISLADVAGKWRLHSTDVGGGNAVESELTATADTTGWTWTLPNRKPVAVRIIAVGGDSIVTEAGPYESVLRSGMRVRNHTVYRLKDGKLVGAVEARFVTSKGDSLVQRQTEGTRVP